jgi:glycosyltransferase involved in cell wall biosynthesis
MERKLNILFLPENIASIPALTASSLNKKENIVAKCLSRIEHKYQQQNDTLVFLPKIYPKNNPFKWFYSKWQYRKQLKKWIYWADVLHYSFTTGLPNGADLKWARKLKKPIIIEWVGSDIRNPDFLKKINPYYKDVFENGYEYAHVESQERSLKIQKLFAKYKAVPVFFPEMKLYINQSLFEKSYLLYQRINIKSFIPEYPSVSNRRPVIVHSPSAKIAKGTNILLPIIEFLKKDFDFEFILLHDLERERVLETLKSADIFIDQLILGNYGMASIEAMSFGKPVMCYLMPEIFEAGLSADCPIINANPDNFKDQLIRLITDAELRNKTGRKSRQFAEKYHDVEKISAQLLNIYKTALENSH